MHNLLEEYLSEIAAQLNSLPPKRRMEELREVRTHLENAVLAGREKGQPEDEAVRDALAQFGMPGALGDNLVQAWRREQMLNRRSLFGAAAFTVGALFFLYFLLLKPLLVSCITFIAHSNGHLMADAPFLTVYRWSHFVIVLIGPIAIGAVSATLFSRKAFSGAVLGVIVFSCYCWAALGISVSTYPGHLGTHFFVNYAIDNEQLAVPVLMSAWLISRFRMARQRLKYQAAAK